MDLSLGPLSDNAHYDITLECAHSDQSPFTMKVPTPWAISVPSASTTSARSIATEVPFLPNSARAVSTSPGLAAFR